jgi:hypothetical protein
MFLADDILKPSDQLAIARRLTERLADSSKPKDFGGNQYTEGFWIARRDQCLVRLRVQLDRMRALGLHELADSMEIEAATLTGEAR